jgi:hypothetical protein
MVSAKREHNSVVEMLAFWSKDHVNSGSSKHACTDTQDNQQYKESSIHS